MLTYINTMLTINNYIVLYIILKYFSKKFEYLIYDLYSKLVYKNIKLLFVYKCYSVINTKEFINSNESIKIKK